MVKDRGSMSSMKVMANHMDDLTTMQKIAILSLVIGL